MLGSDGSLSIDALKLIGGLVNYADSLSAFGNTVASAYLRLVPDQEAPTRICWSDCNRSALIRVPLGWSETIDLASKVNPGESEVYSDERGRQTVEIRSPDGSALFHLLLAGLTTAAEFGLTKEGMVELARKTKIEGNLFSDPSLLDQLEPLPRSCVDAANLLKDKRAMYEEFGVFPKRIIDYVADLLLRENDASLSRDLAHMPTDERLPVTRHIMHRDIF
jgi:glutamine synthetase